MFVMRRYLAPAGLALAVAFLAGCEDASTLTGVQDLDGPLLADHDPASEVCQVASLDAFAHGNDINAVAVNFGGAIGTVTFNVTTTPPSASSISDSPAKAFDVNLEAAPDPDIQDDDGVFGNCTDCNGDGSILVIPNDDFAGEGDSDAGGDVAFERADGEEFRVASFEAYDQETTAGEGITLCAEDDASDDVCEADDASEVVDEAASVSANASSTSVANASGTFNDVWIWDFDGSGAINDLKLCVEAPGGGEGCTPGYWKQSQHFDSWTATGYTTGTTFGSVFTSCDLDNNLQNPESGNVCSLTLLQALRLRGGGLNALARHAVAALLNSSHTNVSFDLTEGQVIDAVNTALEDEDYGDTKDDLADLNEQGCPLN